MLVPIRLVRANPAQPRKAFDEQALQGLAASLKQSGAIQPIVVRPADNGYELVAGERRLRAASIAGLAELPAIIRPVRDEEMLELALIENIQRQDLNPIDRARAYQNLVDRHGLSHDQIAARTGEDRTTVVNYLRLLALQYEIQEMVSTGELSTGHAKALLSITDKKLQYEIARRVVAGKWSVRQTEAAAAKTREAGGGKAKPEARAAVKDVEATLSTKLGTRVRIQEGRRRHTGKVIIEYYSLEDFDRITGLLGMNPEPA